MSELKTLKVKQRFINYKVLSYIWLANTHQAIKRNVLSVGMNINQPMEEVKLAQMNVEKREKGNMIKSILGNIQRLQEKHLKIGNRIIERRSMRKRKKDGEKIRDYKLETIQMNLLEKRGLRNMDNANYVVSWEIEKPTILNIQGRILF